MGREKIIAWRGKKWKKGNRIKKEGKIKYFRKGKLNKLTEDDRKKKKKRKMKKIDEKKDGIRGKMKMNK